MPKVWPAQLGRKVVRNVAVFTSDSFFHTTNNSLKSSTENYLIRIFLIWRSALSIFDHLETRNKRILLWSPLKTPKGDYAPCFNICILIKVYFFCLVLSCPGQNRANDLQDRQTKCMSSCWSWNRLGFGLLVVFHYSLKMRGASYTNKFLTRIMNNGNQWLEVAVR